MATRRDANDSIFRDLVNLKWSNTNYSSLNVFDDAEKLPFFVCQLPKSYNQQADNIASRRFMRVGALISQHRVVATDSQSRRAFSLPITGANWMRFKIRHGRKWYDLGIISDVVSYIDVSNDTSLYLKTGDPSADEALSKLMNTFNRSYNSVNFSLLTGPPDIIELRHEFLQTNQLTSSALHQDTRALLYVEQSLQVVDSTQVTATESTEVTPSGPTSPPTDASQDEIDKSMGVQVEPEREILRRRKTHSNPPVRSHSLRFEKTHDSRDHLRGGPNPKKDKMRSGARATAQYDDVTVGSKTRDYNGDSVVKMTSRDAGRKIRNNYEDQSITLSPRVSNGIRQVAIKAEVVDEVTGVIVDDPREETSRKVHESETQSTTTASRHSNESHTHSRYQNNQQDETDRRELSRNPNKSLLLDGNLHQSGFDQTVTWDGHRRPIYQTVEAELPRDKHGQMATMSSYSSEHLDRLSTEEPYQTPVVNYRGKSHSEIAAPRFEVGFVGRMTEIPQVTRAQVPNEKGLIAADIINDPYSDGTVQASVFTTAPVQRLRASSSSGSVLGGRTSNVVTRVVDEDRNDDIAAPRVYLTSPQATSTTPHMAATPSYLVQERPFKVTSKRSTVQDYQYNKGRGQTLILNKPRVTLRNLEKADTARVTTMRRHRSEVTFANDIETLMTNGEPNSVNRNQEVNHGRRRLDSESSVIRTNPYNDTWVGSSGTLPTRLRGNPDESFTHQMAKLKSRRTTPAILNSPQPRQRPGPTHPSARSLSPLIITTATSNQRNHSRRLAGHVTPTSAMSSPGMSRAFGEEARYRKNNSPNWTPRKQR